MVSPASHLYHKRDIRYPYYRYHRYGPFYRYLFETVPELGGYRPHFNYYSALPYGPYFYDHEDSSPDEGRLQQQNSQSGSKGGGVHVGWIIFLVVLIILLPIIIPIVAAAIIAKTT